MDHATWIALTGLGYAVPDAVRGNDDPVFDWLNQHQPAGGELFNGLKYRRVLKEASDLSGLMVQAARAALRQAQLPLDQVDMILGSGSVGASNAPNELAAVHRDLGLASHCRVMPLNTDYTNFHDGLKLAHDLVQTGTIRHALVACGNNWTHHVDYHEAVALAASDGAGAAVVGRTGDRQRFRLLDWENETQTGYDGALRMAPRVVARPVPDEASAPDVYTVPLMKIDDQTGAAAIKAFGLPAPGRVVMRMLARHGLTGQDITLVAHQSSLLVQQAWQAAIQPAHYISTLEDYGDMVSASVPVNLAKCHDEIATRHLVLLGIGMEMHATALLLVRG